MDESLVDMLLIRSWYVGPTFRDLPHLELIVEWNARPQEVRRRRLGSRIRRWGSEVFRDHDDCVREEEIVSDCRSDEDVIVLEARVRQLEDLAKMPVELDNDLERVVVEWEVDLAKDSGEGSTCGDELSIEGLCLREELSKYLTRILDKLIGNRESLEEGDVAEGSQNCEVSESKILSQDLSDLPDQSVDKNKIVGDNNGSVWEYRSSLVKEYQELGKNLAWLLPECLFKCERLGDTLLTSDPELSECRRRLEEIWSRKLGLIEVVERTSIGKTVKCTDRESSRVEMVEVANPATHLALRGYPMRSPE
jgi:hypothetical protein